MASSFWKTRAPMVYNIAISAPRFFKWSVSSTLSNRRCECISHVPRSCYLSRLTWSPCCVTNSANL